MLNVSLVSNLTIATTSTPIWFPVRDITLSEWCIVVSFALILSAGVFGNVFVIYVFGYKRKSNRRSTTELLIFYLGIIDFLSSLLNPPLYIYWTLTNYRRWDFGYLGCQIIPSLGPIMTSASCGVLLIIAVDRYIAIVAPFSGELTPKTVTIAFFFDIVVSICFYLHYILALRIHPKYKYCFVPDVADYKYGIPNCAFVILRLCLFATVFSFTNVKILKTLKKCEVTSTSKQIQAACIKQSKSITILLLTMGMVFTLLVFPRELFYLVYNLSWMVSKNGVKFNSTLNQINSWLKVAHTANSCANMFIYSNMQTIYRKQIIRVFTFFGNCKLIVTLTSFTRDKTSLRKTRRFTFSKHSTTLPKL
ncbi:C5a anaphylatoxin chemotactic receptor 1-like [Hydra vulgaris]|uniref:C5a anaphylatoxin chemotactic receptor 1-like n=1 Tax=Hydra vulgaris TaxID=6087 RepID=A0ABM4B4V6_HYDVU